MFTSSANFHAFDKGKPTSRKRGGSSGSKDRKSWAEMEEERKPRLRSRGEEDSEDDFDDEDLDDDDLDDEDDDDLDWDEEEDDGDWGGDDYKDDDE